LIGCDNIRIGKVKGGIIKKSSYWQIKSLQYILNKFFLIDTHSINTNIFVKYHDSQFTDTYYPLLIFLFRYLYMKIK